MPDKSKPTKTCGDLLKRFLGRMTNILSCGMNARVFLLALAATVAISWSACGGSAQAEHGIVRGGVLAVATLSEPPHLNPAITTSGPVHTVTGSIFNGLVGLGEHADPVPELAERWQITDAGKTYSFSLRKDVRWHDGAPFTSADVKFTFEEILLKHHARTRAGLEAQLAGIDAPDPHTVIFRFKQPYAPLLRRLDAQEAPILPRHLYQGRDPLTDPINARPVGTGSFRFSKWVRGDSIVLTRNPDYFRKGRPYLDQIVFRTLPNAPAAAIALETQEIDFLGGMGGPEQQRLRDRKGIATAHSAAGPGGSYCINTLIPNLRQPLLQNLKVRQAINAAIDRRFIVERVHFGIGRPARGPIQSSLSWSDRTLPDMESNAERAAVLLNDAGYGVDPNGVRFKLRFVYSQSGFSVLAEVLKEQLRKVGVDLVLEPADFNAAVDRVFIKGDFDLGVASYCNGSDPDIGVKRVYHSANILPIPFGNGAGYKNSEVDSLFDQAARTLNEEERRKLYRQVQQILVREVPYFWLVETEGDRAFRSAVKGLKIWSGNTFEEAYIVDHSSPR